MRNECRKGILHSLVCMHAILLCKFMGGKGEGVKTVSAGKREGEVKKVLMPRLANFPFPFPQPHYLLTGPQSEYNICKLIIHRPGCRMCQSFSSSSFTQFFSSSSKVFSFYESCNLFPTQYETQIAAHYIQGVPKKCPMKRRFIYFKYLK